MTPRITIGLVLVSMLPAAVYALTPLGTGFTYQGLLKDGGSPANGTFNMDFRLYPVPAGGTLLASQTLPGVSVSDGLFTVQVDFGAGVFDGNQRWLDVTVNGTPLVPRQELTAAPNALFALNAATASNATQLNGQPAPFYQNASNTNSGTLADARLSANVALLNAAQTFSAGKTFSAAPSFTAAGSPFSVTSTTLVTNLSADWLDGLNSSAFLQSIPVPLTLSGTSVTHIIQGENASANGSSSGVYGLTTGAGQSSGVYGLASTDTGINVGVRGRSLSTSGRGVLGWASADTGTNFGVVGQSDSTSGRGVWGVAPATSGANYGGRFDSYSVSGIGVYGRANATSGSIYGVYGQASTAADGYAVYAAGDMGASGVKPFRIDHPDDPENKYLLHYAAESPEVINFYSGKATLDGAGQAVVELPRYFAKINKDPRYTLTAVGAPMPMLHVAEEIDEAALSTGSKLGPGEVAPLCSFRIAGGKPGAKVSWRVETVRNDRWVQQRGAPVEVEKQDLEKGTYQHPELYDQPAEMGMDYRPEPSLPLAAPDATPLADR